MSVHSVAIDWYIATICRIVGAIDSWISSMSGYVGAKFLNSVAMIRSVRQIAGLLRHFEEEVRCRLRKCDRLEGRMGRHGR